MLYKFKSKACADVIMLGPQGDQALRLLGREPAAKGIIEVGAMPSALAVMNAALAAHDSAAKADSTQAREQTADPHATLEAELEAEPDVGLRQRLWPLTEMMRQAHAAGEPIVWGV